MQGEGRRSERYKVRVCNGKERRGMTNLAVEILKIVGGGSR